MINSNLDLLDLDINNYNLQDILTLFNIPINFDETDLKKAKAIVLKTHPDKSKLPSTYFLFYSKAYKMLYSVWEFKKQGDIDNQNPNTDYNYSDYSSKEKNLLLDNYFNSNKKNKKNFNEWFNKQFEQNKLYNESESKGYGDWLQTNDDLDDNTRVSSLATMKDEFDKRKGIARSLIISENIQELYESNSISSELSNNAPSTYDSGLFDSLGFQDLYKAHTESVIPVTDEDYEKRQKFNNVNEFISYRNNQNTTPLSELQSQQYLNNRNNKEEEKSVRRAYELAKQTEQSTKNNNEFWSKIQLLQN